ncbi:MAG: hypothetical protein Q4D24_00055 [Erysipelotrichaceae bacterium]|nr:hypothetical protein [Erysipelotrichaceae bacterium]
MNQTTKQLLSVLLAFQMSLQSLPAVHAEEPENTPEIFSEQITEEETEISEEEVLEEIVSEEEEPAETEEPVPEETEEPEIIEVPEIPEVTEDPEPTAEPDTPAVTEILEETELPEAAEIPAEQEEPAEEPEELPELEDGQPFQLNLAYDEYKQDSSIALLGHEYDTGLSNGTYKIEYSYYDAQPTYIVARTDDTTFWFLDYNDDTSGGVYTRNVKFNIPSGSYEVRAAFFQDGILHFSSNWYRLFVLDPPRVKGTGSFKGSQYGYIDLDIYPLKDMSWAFPSTMDYDLRLCLNEDGPKLNLAKMKYYADGNTFRLQLGDSTAYDGAGTYTDYPYGSFDLFYEINGASATTPDYIFAGSPSTHVDIISEFEPDVLQIEMLEIQHLNYKGATAKIQATFKPLDSNDCEYEGIDRRITYTSSNTKYLKVDANGVVTVTGLPDVGKTELVTITAKSTAYPALTDSIVVPLRHVVFGKSDLKVRFDGQEYTTFNWTIGTQQKYLYPSNPASAHMAEVIFRFEEPLDGLFGMPVTFSADGRGMQFQTDTSIPPSDSAVYENLYTGIVGTDGTVMALVRCFDPGSYKINVSTPIGRTGTVTINIDGITNSFAGSAVKNSQFLINGKPAAGWIRYDILTDSYVLGKDVFKGYTDPANQKIYYADPSTKKLVTGDPENGYGDTTARIDGKLYAFSANNGLIVHIEGGVPVEGSVPINHEKLFEEYYAYVNKNGEIQTGWTDTIYGTYYLDPEFGYTVYSEFVPARSGKGYTYVDNSGEAIGIYVKTGVTQELTEADGFYKVFTKNGTDYFWVKSGAFHTGWLYLHFDSKTGTYTWNTTAKGAIEKMYFDPSNNGAMRLGSFYAGTKAYISDKAYTSEFTAGDYYTVPLLNCGLFGNGKFPEKYGLHPTMGIVVDSDGAIVSNKLVRIAVWDGSKYDRYYVYTGSDGRPEKSVWKTINGKTYYFDAAGYLVTDALYSTPFRFYDSESLTSIVYSKLKNAKKPEEGYTYHSADGKKLTSLLIYDESGNPVVMVDAKGCLVVNKLATVKTSQAPGAASETYIADSYGQIVVNDTSSAFKAVKVGSKTYIVDYNGIVQKNSSEPVKARFDNNSTASVMADKNGVLVTKTFKTVTTEANGTFKVYFDAQGRAVGNGPELYYDGNYYYGLYVNKKVWLAISASGGYPGCVIPGKTIIPGTSGDTFQTGWFGNSDSPIYLNKDGSIKSGLVKHDQKTTYIGTFIYEGTGYAYRLFGEYVPYPEGVHSNLLYSIKGKTYFLDEDGFAITGWVHFEHAVVVNGEEYIREILTAVKTLDDVYMYFDDKTGAAVTGSAKVPVPYVFNGEISLGEEGAFPNNAKRVNTTASLKTLYFTSDGALIRDQNTKIGKKLSEVGADGIVTSGAPHWSDANRNTYVLKNGVLATGRTKVDGKYYYFDTDTGLKVVNALRKTGSKWYYYGQYGEQETPDMTMRPFNVNMPGYMQDKWGIVNQVMIGSTNGKDLYAVWNKDGSLAKIVYYGTSKPAAGESVSFGLWSSANDKFISYITAGLNGYVLDSKGLPMTGVTANFTFKDDFDSYTFNIGKDGKKVTAGVSLSLVKNGKKYYVMSEGLIISNPRAVVRISDWSGLPAAEQKSLNELAWIAECYGSGLYVMFNPDGSVAVNTKRYATALLDHSSYFGSSVSCTFTTNKQGIVLDLVAPLYKVGKTTYFSNALEVPSGSGEFRMPIDTVTIDSSVEIEALVKYSGNKITGFYDAYSGKPLTGLFMMYLGSRSMMIWLKNGQPQSGTKSVDAYGLDVKFYVDPNMAGTILQFY